MSLPLRMLLIVNAVATLAAGVVLFVFPAAIPATAGIALAPGDAFVAWLLGAAEIAVAALCARTLLRRRPHGTPVEPHPELVAATVLTLIVLHALSALADGMAMLHNPSPTLAINLAVRIAMVALLVVFRPRQSH
jgi:hypothetical protein